MSHFRITPFAVASITSLLLGMACSSGGAEEGEEFGSATIAITQAPADVLCVSITAAGKRTVARAFDVQPGQSTVLSMNQISTGAVNFSGAAYAVPCTSIEDPNLVAGWLSGVETVEVLPNTVASVTLRMSRNGRAQVNVDFEEDCSSDGAACTSDAACCSGRCDAATQTCIANCRPDGSLCNNASDCCSGSCSDGVCSQAPVCSPNGSPCTTASDCCSTICSNGVCSPAPTCSPDGSQCNADSDCCSSLCDLGTCFSGCSPTGTRCSSDASCCSGFCDLLDPELPTIRICQ